MVIGPLFTNLPKYKKPGYLFGNPAFQTSLKFRCMQRQQFTNSEPWFSVPRLLGVWLSQKAVFEYSPSKPILGSVSTGKFRSYLSTCIHKYGDVSCCITAKSQRAQSGSYFFHLQLRRRQMKTIMPSAMGISSTLPGRVKVYFISSFSTKRNKKKPFAHFAS